MDTVDWWSLVRFAHAADPAMWVGGQMALSMVILPLPRHLLAYGTVRQHIHMLRTGEVPSQRAATTSQ
ncbi:hypothetical protein QBC31_41305 [Streptomyces sp. B21-079]|uniref:hypothetical protein n=1 Tax=Streptomyces sp. B21-079 TaxID=3039409 RepID=UPI002FF24829